MSGSEAATASKRIETALGRVAAARRARKADVALGRWAEWVKRLQCERFTLQYADLLAHPTFGGAARFFLTDLYAPRDFSERDAQFARISGAIERLFPRDVADTATLMAQLHALSEELDNNMAEALIRNGAQASAPAYRSAWRSLNQSAPRRQQLSEVMALGARMDELTRRFGLRTALTLMRGPARAAGLKDLQGFLERGFDAFAAMSDPKPFLAQIQAREAGFLAAMDGPDGPASTSEGLEAWRALERASLSLQSPA
jgi:hypothetical protein